MAQFPESFRRMVGEYAAQHGSHEAHRRWPEVPARTARTWRRQLGYTTDAVGRPTKFEYTREDERVEPFEPHEHERPAWSVGPAGAATTTATPAGHVEFDVKVSSKRPNECDVERVTTEKVRTLADLIRVCEIDAEEWEVVSWEAKAYQQGMRPWATGSTEAGWARKDDEPRINQLFSVTAKLKRKVAVIDARAEIEALVAEAKAHVVRAPLVYVRPPNPGYMLELSLPDLHFGRLSWPTETGGPAYDLSISLDLFYKAAESLLDRARHLQFEKILWIVGNDALHVDGLSYTTTRGTPQDVDGRPLKVFRAVRQAHCTLGERLRKIAPLQVVGMKGNHDGVSALMLLDAMDCWFHSDPHVTIDGSPRARKYAEWGRNLIGFTHGDEGKPDSWVKLMPVEAPLAWARTTYREIHAGHRHKDFVHRDEVNGVKVRMLPSLAAADAWHAGQGFVGNIPSAEAFFWHADDGLVGTAVYNHKYEAA